MRKNYVLSCLSLAIFLYACNKGGAFSGELDAGGSRIISAAAPGPGNGGNQPGVITAGEWNDLSNWSFWDELLKRDTIKTYPEVWGFYTKERITITVKDAAGKLLHDAKVIVTYQGNSFTAKTDNKGVAEIFPALNNRLLTTPAQYSVQAEYNGQTTVAATVQSSQKKVDIKVNSNKTINETLDIMFVVDATGSMGDEINYLKTEVADVINRAHVQLPAVNLRMASLFYRDEGDEYVTRPFDFTTNTSSLKNFIANQRADGGGDFPEAVDKALDVAVNQMQWSSKAINRILFLILDAPPHKENDHLQHLRNAVVKAQEKGIRIIPVTASGINRETEFLMRFLSIGTNSTYVFITNHSGIGNQHLTPTVGNYQVEFLNNLMVRLITEYGKNID